MVRGIFSGLLGVTLGLAMASAVAADPGNGNGNGGVGNGNGNGNEKHVVTAPEINPAGIAVVGALLLGGVALITSRVGGRKAGKAED